MKLDPIMCDWCSESTPAIARAHQWNTGELQSFSSYLCSTHCQEVASEFTTVNLYPLTGHKPEYTSVETYASPMTTEYTVKELDLAAKYGTPYPVCGDLTTRKHIGKSWVGHDPNGEQY